MLNWMKRISIGLGLLGLVGWTILTSSAANGRVAIAGPTSATCDLLGGAVVPAAAQGEGIDIQVEDWQPEDIIAMWITFPDGRVYDVASAQGLDGLFDFVADNQTRFRVPTGRGALYGYPITGQFPLGCHRLTVHSLRSGDEAVAAFVVQAGGQAATGPATINVVPEQVVQQGNTSITLQGFVADEDIALWLTQPNGSVVDLGRYTGAGPSLTIETFSVPAIVPVGQHQLTAYGLRSGYIAITRFEVLPGDPGPPSASARIEVFLTHEPQRSTFLIAGSGFGDGESITFWLTYPNGKVLELGDDSADVTGSISVNLYVSEQFPTGTYAISARGNTTGTLAIASFGLTEPTSTPQPQSTTNDLPPAPVEPAPEIVPPLDPIDVPSEPIPFEPTAEPPVATPEPPVAEPTPEPSVEPAPPVAEPTPEPSVEPAPPTSEAPMPTLPPIDGGDGSIPLPPPEVQP